MARDSDEDSDDDVLNVPCTADENETSDVLQPFTRAASIVMNIKVGLLILLIWFSRRTLTMLVGVVALRG